MQVPGSRGPSVRRLAPERSSLAPRSRPGRAEQLPNREDDHDVVPARTPGEVTGRTGPTARWHYRGSARLDSGLAPSPWRTPESEARDKTTATTRRTSRRPIRGTGSRVPLTTVTSVTAWGCHPCRTPRVRASATRERCRGRAPVRRVKRLPTKRLWVKLPVSRATRAQPVARTAVTPRAVTAHPQRRAQCSGVRPADAT